MHYSLSGVIIARPIICSDNIHTGKIDKNNIVLLTVSDAFSIKPCILQYSACFPCCRSSLSLSRKVTNSLQLQRYIPISIQQKMMVRILLDLFHMEVVMIACLLTAKCLCPHKTTWGVIKILYHQKCMEFSLIINVFQLHLPGKYVLSPTIRQSSRYNYGQINKNLTWLVISIRLDPAFCL